MKEKLRNDNNNTIRHKIFTKKKKNQALTKFGTGKDLFLR